MWNIYGKQYDLTDFMENHPGGSQILENTKYLHDCTPLFESYHSMTNKDIIRYKLEKYCINNNKTYNYKYTFKKEDFYDVLTNRVKIKMNQYYKSDNIFYIKSIIFFYIYFFMTYLYLFSKINIIYKCILSFLCGILEMILNFTIMHDASHYALFKNPKKNELLCKIFCSWTLWNGSMWLNHHTIYHHSFTNDYKDPDTLYSKPFYRKLSYGKHLLNKKNKYFKIWVFIITSIIPGLWLGQVISYFTWYLRGNLWRMKLPKIKLKYYEKIIYIIRFYLILFGLYKNMFSMILYVVGINLTYSINIYGNHDTIETFINSEKNKNITDWGAKQVIESGNFSGELLCFFFGGINYQIEHHLFPNIHHSHYPKISKIVKETCKDFDIEYIHHDSIWDAISSYLNKIEKCN
jgi:linoleoyl-CoA desaturase